MSSKEEQSADQHKRIMLSSQTLEGLKITDHVLHVYVYVYYCMYYMYMYMYITVCSTCICICYCLLLTHFCYF